MTPHGPEPRRLVDGGGDDLESEAMRELLARLVEPPAVEEVSRERIWRRMTAPRPTADRAWYFRMAAVTALMLALTAALALHNRRSASGSSQITLSDEVALQVGVGAEVDVSAFATEHTVRWSGGSVKVVARQAQPPLTVRAGGYVLRASTASFELISQSAGEVAVAVDQGEVEVVEGARRWRVGHGERWSSARRDADAALLEPAAAVAAEPHPAAALRPVAPTVEREPEPVAVPSTAVERSQATTPPSHARAPVAPVIAAADEGTRTRSLAPSRTVAPTALLVPTTEAAPSVDTSPAVVPPPLVAPIVVAERDPLPPPAPAPVPSLAPTTAPSLAPAPPQPYEEGLALERAGRYAEAAKHFQAVVGDRGSHADLALYELGRLDQRQLHDLSGARDAFSSYVDDYPQGSLQQEVRLSLIEVDADLGESRDALKLASRFLDAFPASERAPDVRLLRANLLREKGSCGDALADYSRLTEHPTLGEEALFFSAFCQRQNDRIDDAEASLRELLRRFPHGRYAAEAQAALAGQK